MDFGETGGLLIPRAPANRRLVDSLTSVVTADLSVQDLREWIPVVPDASVSQAANLSSERNRSPPRHGREVGGGIWKDAYRRLLRPQATVSERAAARQAGDLAQVEPSVLLLPSRSVPTNS